VGYEAGMCLLVPRCGPRKSMRVIFGDPECSGARVEQNRRAMAAIVRAREFSFGEARGLEKEAGLGCAVQGIGYRGSCDYLRDYLRCRLAML
jgi:hypothetical protein